MAVTLKDVAELANVSRSAVEVAGPTITRQNALPSGAPDFSNLRIRRRMVNLPVNHSITRITEDVQKLSNVLA